MPRIEIGDLKPLNSTATDVETLNFLCAFLEYNRPKLIIEAGTYQGHFAVMAARLLPESEVWTADITSHAKLPDVPNLHFFHGDYSAMLETLTTTVDFAFVDSGPPCGDDGHCRLRHWKATKEILISGGFAVCHDMNAIEWEGGSEIKEESMYLPGGRGISIWQKP